MAPTPKPPNPTTMPLATFMRDELPPLADIVTFANHLPMSLYADSTVVKSPEVVYRGVATSQNTFVAQQYLLNFRRSDADIGFLLGTNNYTLPMVAGALAARDLQERDDDLIALPPPRNERAPLAPLIRSRRSRRRFSGKAVPLEELSTVLACSSGVTASVGLDDAPPTITAGERPHLDLRAVASGGALYPIHLYIVALDVKPLARGVYRYVPRHHALTPVTGAGASLPPVRDLGQFSDMEVEKAAFLIVYVYHFFENARKYGEQGLAFALIETGGIAAHVHLTCTALGLGSCDVGGFAKGRLERLLDVDGLSRHVVHLTVAGK